MAIENKQQLKEGRYAGVSLGDRVGQSGIEYTYDRYLRGKDGASRIEVDALGRPKGELAVHDPLPGNQLRLSIDLAVQKAGRNKRGTVPAAFVRRFHLPGRHPERRGGRRISRAGSW